MRAIKLERLWKCSVGTGKVEKLAQKLAMEMRGGRKGLVEERDRNKMVRRKVLILMKDKVKDAMEDVELAKVQFFKAKMALWRVVVWRSRVGVEVREVMRGEMSIDWGQRMEQMRKSVNFLVTKHRRSRREEVPDTWREVKVSDHALGEGIHLPSPLLG